MDISLLEKLINIVDKSTLSSFELEEKELHIKIERNIVSGNAAAVLPMQTESSVKTNGNSDNSANNEAEFIYVKSPMVGLFYSLSSLGKTDVSVGTMIKKGMVLCAVEAMKLINEIESDIEGELVEVMVQHGDPVEFGQNLFKLKKV